MRDRLDWLAHEGEVAERGRCAAKLSRSSAWPQTTERTYLIRRSLMFVMRRISDPIQTWHHFRDVSQPDARAAAKNRYSKNSSARPTSGGGTVTKQPRCG